MRGGKGLVGGGWECSRRRSLKNSISEFIHLGISHVFAIIHQYLQKKSIEVEIVLPATY